MGSDIVKRWLQFGFLLMMALRSIQPARAADVIDRIIALVNGQPVLLSDWQDRVRYEAMLEQRSLETVTPQQEQDALQQVIDQKLVEEQFHGRNLPPATDDEIAKRVSELRQKVPGATTDAGWQAVLARYGLNQKQVLAVIGAQVLMVHFASAEILPGVRVENRNVLVYYREKLLPSLRQSGKPAPPLDEVAGEIRDILLQQRAGELLQEWLQSLRSQSEIRMLIGQTAPAGPGPVKAPTAGTAQGMGNTAILGTAQ
jgi:hypothetical protein